MSSFLMMVPIFSTICATMKNQEQIAGSVNILLVPVYTEIQI